jgi:tetratricopeptide (TPR) repeat protein
MFLRMILRLFIIFCLVFSICSCTGSNKEALTSNQLQELQTLYQNKQYFDLRDALQPHRNSSSVMLSFFRGVVANKFNRLDASIEHLDAFIRRQGEERNNGSLLIDALETLGDSYSKRFLYKKAADTYQKMLGISEFQMDADRLKDTENYLRIFDALSDVSPQTFNIDQTSTIQLDSGSYIPMKINDFDIRLGLDTGANYSFIMRSLAEDTRMRIIDADIDVHNVAGQAVKADLGVVSKMEIGGAVLTNVVFLVFKDRDLSIPQANSQIKGAIGFPVAASMREITLHKMNALTIPAAPSSFTQQNLCLEGLTPLVEGYYEGHRLVFCLDTGAGRSVLYPPFYKVYREELQNDYPLGSERVQGLGGFREIPAYIMQSVTLIFGDKKAVFPKLPVLTEETKDDSQYFFGNIGRDLLDQFESMTLNFESMYVKFE